MDRSDEWLMRSWEACDISENLPPLQFITTHAQYNVMAPTALNAISG